MIERPCGGLEALDTPWLGPTEAVPCTAGAPSSIVLPGQVPGVYEVDVVLRSIFEKCRQIFSTQTASVAIAPDATTDVAVQLTGF